MLLSPYRVLDLTNDGRLLCGQILADLGADVIVVEPPGGSPARRIGPFRVRSAERGMQNASTTAPNADPDSAFPIPHSALEESLFWWAYNRDKRGIMLDIETEAGRQALLRLVQTSHFLIESYEPGYLDRRGLGWEALSAINPRLVMVSVTPFGSTGPKAGWAATDLTAWAASGTLNITGDDDRPPVRVWGYQASLHAGSEAAVGALIAHAARERDGLGQHVDVSMQTAAMIATQSFILAAGWGDRPPERVAGGAKLGALHIRFVYPCADGHVSVTFLFGTVIGPYTRRLFEWMHEEGFCDEATRDKDWMGYVTLLLTGQEPVSELERCTRALERFTLSKTKAELFAAAMRRGLLIVPVSTTADVVNSEQLAARDYWTPVLHPELGRSLRYPGPIAKVSATPIPYRRGAPLLGEHNAELLTSPPSPLPSQGRGSATVAGGGVLPSPARGGVGGEVRPALDGVKVLDLSWVFATPAGVRYLSDYGATVIHVESTTRPDALRTYQPFMNGEPGAERSGQYANVQANKLGLSLHLGTEKGRALALKLVEWADIVVESYSPRAMRKWGMDYDVLKKLNPGLIMMSSCLNGQTGPQALLAGFGTMGSQIAGFGALTGWPDRAPAGPFVAYTDYTSPKFIAALLLAALDHRRRTGEGQYIDFSQVESGIHYLAPAMLDYTVNGRVLTRAGNDSAEHAPHGVYPCGGSGQSAVGNGTSTGEAASSSPTADSLLPTAADRWVAIACADEAQWRALCQATGNAGWADDARFATFAARRANREALDAALATWTAARDVDTIEQRLQSAGVPVHRVSTSSDAFADPQLLHRGHFVTTPHPELGPVRLESSRTRLSRTPSVISTPGPMFGQHNETVLRDILGLGEDEIVDLVVSGALE